MKVVLCLCGHAHFAGGRCWCGCPRFQPDTDTHPDTDPEELPCP